MPGGDLVGEVRPRDDNEALGSNREDLTHHLAHPQPRAQLDALHEGHGHGEIYYINSRRWGFHYGRDHELPIRLTKRPARLSNPILTPEKIEFILEQK